MDVYLDGQKIETRVSYHVIVVTFGTMKHSAQQLQILLHYMLCVSLLQGEFASEGVQTHFEIDGIDTYIRATSSGDKHKGLHYTLVLDNSEELGPISNDFVESYPM